MNQNSINLIRHSLSSRRGDDLERAERAFRSFDKKQMEAPYGASDQTPKQILATYRKDRAEVNLALEEFEQLISRK